MTTGSLNLWRWSVSSEPPKFSKKPGVLGSVFVVKVRTLRPEHGDEDGQDFQRLRLGSGCCGPDQKFPDHLGLLGRHTRTL
jgi:hypothetical protein